MEKFSDMGEYHDPTLRLERTDLAQEDFNKQVNPVFVEQVVHQVQHELAPVIKQTQSVREIKIQAMHRFLDLIEKQLLTNNEADRCYQRFVQMVDFYYGQP